MYGTRERDLSNNCICKCGINIKGKSKDFYFKVCFISRWLSTKGADCSQVADLNKPDPLECALVYCEAELIGLCPVKYLKKRLSYWIRI